MRFSQTVTVKIVKKVAILFLSMTDILQGPFLHNAVFGDFWDPWTCRISIFCSDIQNKSFVFLYCFIFWDLKEKKEVDRWWQFVVVCRIAEKKRNLIS